MEYNILKTSHEYFNIMPFVIYFIWMIFNKNTMSWQNINIDSQMTKHGDDESSWIISHGLVFPQFSLVANVNE